MSSQMFLEIQEPGVAVCYDSNMVYDGVSWNPYSLYS